MRRRRQPRRQSERLSHALPPCPRARRLLAARGGGGARAARSAPWQRERLAVPQGMTGWWQVNGRSDKPMHLNTQDDLYYVHNYSLLLDLLIMLKTVWVVLRGKGAY